MEHDKDDKIRRFNETSEGRWGRRGSPALSSECNELLAILN